MVQSKLDERIHQVLSEFELISPFFAGYPVNHDFDYSALYPLLAFPANNVGDPFGHSRYQTNTHETEREVVQQVAELMRLPPDEAWGYVTAGGTEGNMYGIYVGRELLRDPVAYFSQDTHYSVLKILHVLNIRNIMIRSQDNGEMDYDDLRESIRINRDAPALIIANIGTTMKGAVDNLDTIREIIEDLALPRSYIHADAALSGMILPFVDDPQPFGFDSGIDSIAISGHKMIGSPLPCGVVVTKKEYTAQIGRAIEYVGALDTTLLGSRNAITPMIIWYSLTKHGGGRLPRYGGEDAGHRRIRGSAVQRERDSRLAKQEQRYGRLPAPLAIRAVPVATRPARRHRAHDYDAAYYARDGRRSYSGLP